MQPGGGREGLARLFQEVPGDACGPPPSWHHPPPPAPRCLLPLADHCSLATHPLPAAPVQPHDAWPTHLLTRVLCGVRRRGRSRSTPTRTRAWRSSWSRRSRRASPKTSRSGRGAPAEAAPPTERLSGQALGAGDRRGQGWLGGWIAFGHGQRRRWAPATRIESDWVPGGLHFAACPAPIARRSPGDGSESRSRYLSALAVSRSEPPCGCPPICVCEPLPVCRHSFFSVRAF